MRALVLFMLAGATSSAQAQSLAITGECPGAMTFDITGVTPGAQVVILAGSGSGSAPIPSGPCAGEDSGLDGVLRWVGPMRDADGDGVITLRPSIPGPVCDLYLSVVDAISCDVSPAEPVSGGDAVPFANELWVDGYAYASIDDVPVDAGYGDWLNNCQEDPYPLPDGWEIVPNFPGVEDVIYMGGWSTHCMLVEAGCTYGTSNYSYGNCYEPCGLMGADGEGNYWATSCSRRVMIRRRL